MTRPASPQTRSGPAADGPEGWTAGAVPTSVGSARPVRAPRPGWESAYATSLAVLDAALVTVAAGIALWLRFGDGATQQTVGTSSPALLGTTYALLVAALPPVWVVSLALRRAYESRYLGIGSEEFKRVVSGTIRLGALLAFTAYALNLDVARGFFFVALPLGCLLLLAGRYGARKVLHTLRARGSCLHRVAAVGTREEVAHLTSQVDLAAHSGLEVVAAFVPGDGDGGLVVGDRVVPVLGEPRDVPLRLAELRADTVAVAGTSALSARELRELSWQLEGTGVDLVVSPALTDVAGPRIRIRPVAGLPLLHVEEPTFGGVRKVVKTSIDLATATLLLVLLLPIGLLVAALVKWDSPGPVFYRQVRVGMHGRPFRIWKFRTMRAGADAELPMLAEHNEHDGPLFKMRDDPRVTRVGRWLRKLSVDELPQLINVVTGSMSLVGPRPPLPAEVEEYADHVRRRLLVKPGITGLWQVSGRADLTWEEAVRLDLYYVENWSVVLDVMIMWKTLWAVLRSRGAY